MTVGRTPNVTDQASQLIGSDGGADAVRSSFIWLLLPGVLIGVIELLGRSGGNWPNVALRRSLGAVVWLGAAAMWHSGRCGYVSSVLWPKVAALWRNLAA